MKRLRKVLGNDTGASNVEIIVWISVCLVIATALFLFRDQIVSFITSATQKINQLKVE